MTAASRAKRMRTGPMISLGLSILIGIVAVFWGRGWFSSEADAGTAIIAEPVSVAEAVQTRTILVADIQLERGDLLSRAALREEEWPVDILPQGALTEIDALLSDEGTWPASVGVVVPGEPLVLGKFTHDAVRNTLAAIIEPGFRAISIHVDDASGVAGFVLPDHRVDVNVFEDTVHSVTGAPLQTAKTLLTDIRVLAVDQTFTDSVEGAAVARTVTLQVSPSQARSLGKAVQSGRIGLVLRPTGEKTLAPKPRSTPRPVVAKAPSKRAPSFANIRVIEGDEEKTISAPDASNGESR